MGTLVKGSDTEESTVQEPLDVIGKSMLCFGLGPVEMQVETKCFHCKILALYNFGCRIIQIDLK